MVFNRASVSDQTITINTAGKLEVTGTLSITNAEIKIELFSTNLIEVDGAGA